MDFEPIVETNCVHNVSKSWSHVSELNYYARKLGWQTLDKYCRIVEINHLDEIRINSNKEIVVIRKGDIMFTGTLDELAEEENGDAIKSFQMFLRNLLFSSKISQDNYNRKKWSKREKKWKKKNEKKKSTNTSNYSS